MENAGLIDHGSAGVARSVSKTVQLVGSISRGPSSSSSASSSPPREPAAARNPSGGNAVPATTAGTVWTTRLSASPPRPPASVPLAIATPKSSTEDNVSKLDLAIMACGISLVVLVALNFKDHASGWDAPWKELYGALMIFSLASTVTGLFTAWCPDGSWGRRLSPVCARFGLVDAAALFVVFFSCKLGRFGCAAGIAAATLVVLVLAVVWAWSERRPATAGRAEAAATVQGGAGLSHYVP